jgi:hypothetical protein
MLKKKVQKVQDSAPTLKNKETKEMKRVREASKASGRCVLDGEIESHELLRSRMNLDRFLYDWQEDAVFLFASSAPAVRSGVLALQVFHFNRILRPTTNDVFPEGAGHNFTGSSPWSLAPLPPEKSLRARTR